jgi:hypothetical protein
LFFTFKEIEYTEDKRVLKERRIKKEKLSSRSGGNGDRNDGRIFRQNVKSTAHTPHTHIYGEWVRVGSWKLLKKRREKSKLRNCTILLSFLELKRRQPWRYWKDNGMLMKTSREWSRLSSFDWLKNLEQSTTRY